MFQAREACLQRITLERTQIFRDVGNLAFSALLNVEAPQELLKVDDKDKRRRGVVKQPHASKWHPYHARG
jgi:hypothetical protein